MMILTMTTLTVGISECSMDSMVGTILTSACIGEDLTGGGMAAIGMTHGITECIILGIGMAGIHRIIMVGTAGTDGVLRIITATQARPERQTILPANGIRQAAGQQDFQAIVAPATVLPDRSETVTTATTKIITVRPTDTHSVVSAVQPIPTLSHGQSLARKPLLHPLAEVRSAAAVAVDRSVVVHLAEAAVPVAAASEEDDKINK